jgi:hypothetical protein
MKRKLLLTLLLTSIYLGAQAQYALGIVVDGTWYPNGSIISKTCGQHTFRVYTQTDPAYSWGWKQNAKFELPSGWQISQNTSATDKIIVTDQNSGGVIKFTNVYYSYNFLTYGPFDVQVTINRPTPSLSVTGDDLICSGQSKTYNLSGSVSGDQISWSTNLSGSSSSTSVQISASGNPGASYVTANVNTANGCGTFSATKSVWAGIPTIQAMSLYSTPISPYTSYNVCQNDYYTLYPTYLGNVSLPKID